MTSQNLYQQMQKQMLDSDADICPPASFHDLTTHLHRRNVFAFACLSSWRRKILGAEVLNDSVAAARSLVLPQPGVSDRLESLIPQIFVPESPVNANSKKIVRPSKLDSLDGRLRATENRLADTKGSVA